MRMKMPSLFMGNLTFEIDNEMVYLREVAYTQFTFENEVEMACLRMVALHKHYSGDAPMSLDWTNIPRDSHH